MSEIHVRPLLTKFTTPDANGVRLLNTSAMINAPFKQPFIVVQKIQIMPQTINNRKGSVIFLIMYLRHKFIASKYSWVFFYIPLFLGSFNFFEAF